MQPTGSQPIVIKVETNSVSSHQPQSGQSRASEAVKLFKEAHPPEKFPLEQVQRVYENDQHEVCLLLGNAMSCSLEYFTEGNRFQSCVFNGIHRGNVISYSLPDGREFLIKGSKVEGWAEVKVD